MPAEPTSIIIAPLRKYKTFSIDVILTSVVPTIVSPKDDAQVESPVYLVFTTSIASAVKKHFEIQVDKTSSAFGDLEINPKSYDNQSNWEYWDGDSWEPLPSEGLDSSYFGNNVRFYTSLTVGNKWWRVRELNRSDS